MKTKLQVALLALCLLAAGCSSADLSAAQAWGKKHKVVLYGCDGKIIQQWTTSGKIENEQHSNGYYFTDDETGIDGTVVITVLN